MKADGGGLLLKIPKEVLHGILHCNTMNTWVVKNLDLIWDYLFVALKIEIFLDFSHLLCSHTEAANLST